MSATLQLNRKDKMLYEPLQFREYEKFGLLDTGAVQSAQSEAELRRFFSAHPAALLQEPRTRVQSPNRQRQHCSSVTTILHWRQSLRRNIHGPPNYGKFTHRNVVLQEVLSNPGLSQQHSEISRQHPPTTPCQREIQK